jgi:hypothetical protein
VGPVFRLSGRIVGWAGWCYIYSAGMGDSPTFSPPEFHSKLSPQCDFYLCLRLLLSTSLRGEAEWLSGDDLLRCLLLRC